MNPSSLYLRAPTLCLCWVGLEHLVSDRLGDSYLWQSLRGRERLPEDRLQKLEPVASRWLCKNQFATMFLSTLTERPERPRPQTFTICHLSTWLRTKEKLLCASSYMRRGLLETSVHFQKGCIASTFLRLWEAAPPNHSTLCPLSSKLATKDFNQCRQ